MEHPTTPDTRKLLQQTVAVDGFLYVLFVVENETGNNGTEQRRRRHLDAVGRLQPVEHTLQVGVYVHRGKLGVAQLVLLSQVQEHLPAVRGVALLQRVLAGKLLSLGFWQLLGSRSRAVLLIGRGGRGGAGVPPPPPRGVRARAGPYPAGFSTPCILFTNPEMPPGIITFVFFFTIIVCCFLLLSSVLLPEWASFVCQNRFCPIA